MEKSEAEELGLAEQIAQRQSQDVEFIQYPIQDRGLPETETFKDLVIEICGDLEGGKAVAVHCRAGIGRTGVLASCILLHNGFEFKDAVSKISAARGVQIPDTKDQLNFIKTYAEGLAIRSNEV